MTSNPTHQDWSTWTNIAYLAPAVVAFMSGFYILSILFATLAVTSGLFHAFPPTEYNPNTKEWERGSLYQKLDVVSIYAILGYLPYVITGNWQILVLSLFLTTPYIVNKFTDPTPVCSSVVVPAMFIGVAILNFSLSWIWALGILSFLIAGVFALISNKAHDELLYFKSDVFHGLWHIFTALGFIIIVIGI